MFRSPNKLLIALLVFLVGIGPVASTIASPHSCAPDAGQSMAAEGMAHGYYGHHKDMNDTHATPRSSRDCDGCDKSCCQGGHCLIGHCAGTAAILQTSIELGFEQFATSETTLTDYRPLAGRTTPPFRPPQA